ncbi:MAG: Rieske 2Fe-2S domain-containing protein [Nitrospinae bacterium]|nr:Rieske 2Fe-2S domain-containing protein [Nitrospinota bacterium]
MKSGTIGLLILGYDKKRYDKWFDKISFNDLMKEYDTPENIQKVFFEPFMKAGFFADEGEISASFFLELFHFYLSGNIGDFRCYHIGGNPQEKVIEPMMRHFLDRGGRINLGSEIENLMVDGDTVKGVYEKSKEIYVYRYDGGIHIIKNDPVEKSVSSKKILLQDIPEDDYIKADLEGDQTIFIGFFGGEVIAVSGECTHAGCSLNWDSVKRRFLCPCHGGQFSEDGGVLNGPPQNPLKIFKVNGKSLESQIVQSAVYNGDYFIIAADMPGIKRISSNMIKNSDAEKRGEFERILKLKTNTCIVVRIWFNKSTKPDRNPVGFVSSYKYITVYLILSRLNEDIKECSKITGLHCIEFIISGASELTDISDEGLLKVISPEIGGLFPELRDAGMIDHSFMRHDNYTFFNKGSLNLRPPVQSVFKNLFYTGDWVYTDIPVFFMEKAVITAKIAANYILSHEGAMPNNIYSPNSRGILSWT